MIPWRKTKPDAAPPPSGDGHRYVFISGHPRSGTNWVSSLLNLHPDCFCDGEFHFQILRWAMDGFGSLPWYLGALEPQKSVAEQSFQQLVRNCLQERARARLSALGRALPPVLGDHTPRVFRLMISPPEARYIVLLRDGRDVLVSYTFHLLNAKAASVIPEQMCGFYQQQLATLDGTHESQRQAGIALLCHEPWVRYYANFWLEQILHDMRIWDAVASQGFGAYVKFVSYEQLRADVEGGRRDIYRHLGLDPEKAAPVSAQTNTAPGFGGREDVTSFYRKGEPGDWCRYFTAQNARWFQETAGEAMRVLGYEPDASWVDRLAATQSPEHIGTPIASITTPTNNHAAATNGVHVQTTDRVLTTH